MNRLLALTVLLVGQTAAFAPMAATGRRAWAKTSLNDASFDFDVSALTDKLTDSIPSSLPDISGPASAASSVQNADLLPIGLALVVLAGGAAAFSASSSSSSTPEKEKAPTYAFEEVVKIDVSIPYDAAAELAYRQLKGLDAEAELDASEFAKFKTLYEAKAVADVIAKKKARDLAELQSVAAAKAKDLESFLA